MLKRILALVLMASMVMVQVPVGVPAFGSSENTVDQVQKIPIGETFTAGTATKLSIEEKTIGEFGGLDQVFWLRLTNATWPDDVVQQLQSAALDPPAGAGYAYHLSFERLDEAQLAVSVTGIVEPVGAKLRLQIPLICVVQGAGDASVFVDARDSRVSGGPLVFATGTSCKITAQCNPYPDQTSPAYRIPQSKDRIPMGAVTIRELTSGAITNAIHLNSNNPAYQIDLSNVQVSATGGLESCSTTLSSDGVTINTADRANVPGSVIITGAEFVKTTLPQIGSAVAVKISADNESENTGIRYGIVTADIPTSGTISDVNVVRKVLIGTTMNDAISAPSLKIEEAVPGIFDGNNQTFRLRLSKAEWIKDADQRLNDLVTDPDGSQGYTYHAEFVKLNDTEMEVTVSNISKSATRIRMDIPLLSTTISEGEATVTVDGRESKITGTTITYACSYKPSIFATISSIHKVEPFVDIIGLDTIELDENTAGSMPGKVHFECLDKAYRLNLSEAVITMGGGFTGKTARFDGQDLVVDLTGTGVVRGSVFIKGVELERIGTPVVGSDVSLRITAENPVVDTSFAVVRIADFENPVLNERMKALLDTDTTLIYVGTGKSTLPDGTVELNIKPSAKPIIIWAHGASGVTWKVNNSSGTRIKAILVDNQQAAIPGAGGAEVINTGFYYVTNHFIPGDFKRMTGIDREVDAFSVFGDCSTLEVPMVVLDKSIDISLGHGSINAIVNPVTQLVGTTTDINKGPKLTIKEKWPTEFFSGDIFEINLANSEWVDNAAALLAQQVKGVHTEKLSYDIAFEKIDKYRIRVTVSDLMNSGYTEPVSYSIPIIAKLTTAGAAKANISFSLFNSISTGSYMFATVQPEATNNTTTSGGGGGGGGGGGSGTFTISAANETEIQQNGLYLKFPAQSYRSDFSFKTAMFSFDKPPVGEGQTLISDIWNMGMTQTGDLQKPYFIRMGYSPSKVDKSKERLVLCWLDEQKNEWIPVEDVKVDYDFGNVTGSTQRQGKFALVATSLKGKTATLQSEDIPLSTPKTILKDIQGHWAAAAINKLMGKGAVSGNPDGTFQPEKQVTRGEFITMLVKALELKGTTDKSFSDLNGHWAAEAIKAAYGSGILTGYEDGTIRPDALITREQMALMITKAAKIPAGVPDKHPTDEALIAPWAKDAVLSGIKAGTISGYADNTFRPQAMATKAEAVAIIARCMK